jgi:hypothetical protein
MGHRLHFAFHPRGIFDVNMPLLYGEEEKAFLRLQEIIVNSTNDLSIFCWISPPTVSGYDYQGVLARDPSYFSHIEPGCTRTHATRVDFSMTSKAVKIRTTLLVRPSLHGVGSDYILPLYYKHARDTVVKTMGIRLRKVGDGLFLRSDPRTVHSIRYDATLRHCPGEHHLLLEHQQTKVSHRTSGLTRSLTNNGDSLMSSMAKSIRIVLNPGSFIVDVWPRSRFDEEEQMYFLSDKDNNLEDWGTVKMLIKPEAHIPTPSVSCMLYITSWGRGSAPQCSILGFQSYSDQIMSLEAELKSWDHTTEELVYALNAKRLPRMSPLLAGIINTPYTTVITLACTKRMDRPSWAPEGHAWDLDITCTVEQTDHTTVKQKERRW